MIPKPMPNMMVCPICDDEVMPESEGTDGEVVTCGNCKTDLVVRDKKAFKSFDLVGTAELVKEGDERGIGGKIEFI